MPVPVPAVGAITPDNIRRLSLRQHSRNLQEAEWQSKFPVRKLGVVMISILLADDHKQVCKALRATLEDCEGWHVCGEAGDGCEAVRLAFELKPDVAVLDYEMPGLNGVEGRVRSKKFCPIWKC